MQARENMCLCVFLSQVFITPMPLLRFMAACGMPHLKNLDEAVNIMRAAMLDVIQVSTMPQVNPHAT